MCAIAEAISPLNRAVRADRTVGPQPSCTVAVPFDPSRRRKGDRWHTDSLTFRLELEDGTPADPPTFRSAPGVSWKAGDTIAIGRRTLRVLGVHEDDADQPPPLVVEGVRSGGGGPAEHGVIGRRRLPFAFITNTADAPSAQLSVKAIARPFRLHSAS
jgi:hypothetical protein